MSPWEGVGKTNEWYTPKHVFDALGEDFDMDVAGASAGADYVPTSHKITLPKCGLLEPWHGFVWMNPPFGGRNGLVPWMDKFFAHGSGIALTPDRTSAKWWQDAALKADALLLTREKVKFIRPDGTVGRSPGSGVTLWAEGRRAVRALKRAEAAGLGLVFVRASA